ncbi:immunity 49 family protein [Nocardiopsis alba]|uniref:immunity 49 family protein n=1 Tax=Nocardiopsis alba TaxID=53437 RepID=UPI003803FA9D
MQRIERHGVDEERIAQALNDVQGRAHSYFIGLSIGRSKLREMQAMGRDLYGHVAARSIEDPTLASDHAFIRKVLATAAEASYGVLDLSLFPYGDLDLPFPLVDDELSNVVFYSPEEQTTFGHGDKVDLKPGPELWVEAFAMRLVSGLIRDRHRGLGSLLRSGYVSYVHDEERYFRFDPASLAQMDALCIYLLEEAAWPLGPDEAALCKPGPEERGQAAQRLDSVEELKPEQRLLRVLLEDDRPAFERALVEHLTRHRELMEADENATPASLLPIGVIALAALAVQTHGWELNITSDYLPQVLLHAPEVPAL